MSSKRAYSWGQTHSGRGRYFAHAVALDRIALVALGVLSTGLLFDGSCSIKPQGTPARKTQQGPYGFKLTHYHRTNRRTPRRHVKEVDDLAEAA